MEYKSIAKRFYKSKQWINTRAAFIALRVQIDGGMCQQCEKELGYIVHHKVHLNASNIINPEIALNHAYLEYVCKPCHDIEHGYCGRKREPQQEAQRYTFDTDGNIIPK